ncbi:uncharacterized protein LOC130648377 [Hydractinia symbiolongicarpus]|uniref:uncharacterized protein LOC130648377 n=1 Tax=Hydractinia symbiolongicarpus TaxID=13093 RepID=UPI00254DF82E|nr:uncharacterized protein LOC130648377 [Hydractinia symbiolongicarpus]
MYPKPDDFDMLPNEVQKAWGEWLSQVPVFGFNFEKYDLKLIKQHFVEKITQKDEEDEQVSSNIFVARKANNYMFLTTSRFKFIDIKNFLAPDLSYGRWCKSLDCRLEKLVVPYEWLTSYDKLNHAGPVKRCDFYSSFKKKSISRTEYQNFRKKFYRRGCVTMMDCLREYNIADVEHFIEAVDKTREQYYDDEIDILKDAVSIPGVSMRYVLNKELEKNLNANCMHLVSPVYTHVKKKSARARHTNNVKQSKLNA